MQLLRTFATVGSLTMLSRVLGFVRDVLVAAAVGAGMGADAFFVAFKIPNMFRRLFAEGAFSAAFVPIYAGHLEEKGKAAARAFAEQSLSVLVVALLGFLIAAEIAMPWLIRAIAPGFWTTPDRFALTVELTRITFPYLLFISIASLCGGVLNSLGRFAAAAATPVLLNLCLIGAVLGLAPLLGSTPLALAWGVALAGFVQAVWLLAALARAGIDLRLTWPRLSPDVRLMLGRLVPLAFGVGIYQINMLIDTIVASLLPAGAISYLFFADRITQLPLGVIGVAAGTALLPLLSRQLRAGDEQGALESQNRTLEFTLFFTLPAAIALAVLAEPVVRVLFERGAFATAETAATAGALAAYAWGIPAYVLVKALAPGFFARGDTATPVKAAAAAMVVNLVLNLLLMGPLQHVGIAAATAVSSWVNALALGFILIRRRQLVMDQRLRTRAPRMLASALALGAALWFAAPLLGEALSAGEARRALALALLIAASLVLYGVLSLVTGAVRTGDIAAFFRRPALVRRS
jgi:putative peptidoglycan lipid II flippase